MSKNLGTLRYDAKFSDRQAMVNSVDPNQTAPRVYTVCHSMCWFWTIFFVERPLCSNLKVITTNIMSVQKFRMLNVAKISIFLIYGCDTVKIE